jgi:hypothetical protein
MAELIVLTLADGASVRCASLADARIRASRHGHWPGDIVLEVTPEGGGPIQSFQFDRQAGDWVPA